jgi:hypothetical protein
MSQEYHGRCVICDAPARKHPRFCYVHDCCDGASPEAVHRARTRHQLEQQRARLEQQEDRAAVRLEWLRNPEGRERAPDDRVPGKLEAQLSDWLQKQVPNE